MLEYNYPENVNKELVADFSLILYGKKMCEACTDSIFEIVKAVENP